MSVVNFVTTIVNSVIVKLIALAIVGLLSYLARDQIIHTAQSIYYYAKNKEVHASVRRIDKYEDIEPSGKLDRSIYQEVKDRSRVHVANPDVRDTYLKIESDDILPHVFVKVEREFDSSHFSQMGSKQPDQQKYKVIIETDPELRFGYQATASLEDFDDLAATISEVVRDEIFDETPPSQSFTVLRLTEGNPPGLGETDSERYEVSVREKGDTLKFRFSNPRKMAHAMQNYFKPY